VTAGSQLAAKAQMVESGKGEEIEVQRMQGMAGILTMFRWLAIARTCKTS
jgi:hypothetical protein